MRIEQVQGYVAENGTIHRTRYDARLENFKILYNRVAHAIKNVDGTDANCRATLYRLALELPNDQFEEYIEAARTLRKEKGIE